MNEVHKDSLLECSHVEMGNADLGLDPATAMVFVLNQGTLPIQNYHDGTIANGLESAYKQKSPTKTDVLWLFRPAYEA